MMACIMITILPVIILSDLLKYIIDGVVAGAVKRVNGCGTLARKEFSVYDHQRYCKRIGVCHRHGFAGAQQ